MMTRSNAILLVAHPGHELRLYHWLERERPTLFVLTDGSGSAGHSRVPSTLAILRETGARAGSILGAFTDHEIYQAIMQRNAAPLAGVTRRLGDALAGADYVVTDAWEGYNPAHDVCRIVAELAVERASRLSRRSIPLYDYAVTERFVARGEANEIVVHLDPAATERKLAAAYAYSELRSDVDDLLRAHGPEQLALEVLRPAAEPATDPKPFYEKRGEQQVAAGRYHEVLRYRDHLAPFLAALADLVHAAPPPVTAHQDRAAAPPPA
jgi:hypothetical protein